MNRLALACFAFCILWLSCCHPSHGQRPASRAAQARNAACTLAFLETYAAARETAGYNRGPLVDYLVRLGGGNPKEHPEYCGFTQAATNRSCGLPIPRNGMQGAAKAWFPLTGPDAKRTLFHRAAGRGTFDSVRVGLKAGFDYGRGIHHVAEVATLGRPLRAGRAPRSVYTWAGNEGKGTNAGMHYTLYASAAIDGLANWLY